VGGRNVFRYVLKCRQKKSKDKEEKDPIDRPNKEDVIAIDLMMSTESITAKEEEPNWFTKTDKHIAKTKLYEEGKESKSPTRVTTNYSQYRGTLHVH
jgi:hypothetical protein